MADLMLYVKGVFQGESYHKHKNRVHYRKLRCQLREFHYESMHCIEKSKHIVLNYLRSLRLKGRMSIR